MKEYKVEIKGLTPLIQNKPEEYGFDNEWVEKKASNDYEKEALKKLYVDKNGFICQPSTHLERCLIEAGKKIRIKGNGKATYSKIFGSMLQIKSSEIKHHIQEWEIFKCLVVIPSTKGRVMRYRPILNNWSLSFVIEFEDEIPSDVIKESLNIAGRYVGIGDWRPEKKGKYGRFELVSFTKK